MPWLNTVNRPFQFQRHPALNWKRALRVLLVRRFSKMATLETLNFDNLALKSLPVDPNPDNRVRPVSGACFSTVKPTPVKNPVIVSYSVPAMALLDLPESELKRPEAMEYFSGNKLLPGATPAAHCYCGHQFGVFSGQLGDGAAMYMGEVVNKKGERWEFQLKGSGLTPYSRTADGRKVLRSTIREYLCSEAMHFLGIPTTRAGMCVTSDTTVRRDVLYNGNVIDEKCSIILRIAPTFLRFGSFEIFKPTDKESGRKGPSVGKTDLLHQLLGYTIKTFYNQIWTEHNEDRQKMYAEFFKEVVRRTARLVGDWMAVGWCHGVLNTDNMSITGLTIDYGPYGFMNSYDSFFVCNGSDDGGRYSYQKQPEICKWNCVKLAEAIQDAIPLSATTPLVEIFDEEYSRHYQMKMRKKLGLKKELPEDGDLVTSLFETMESSGCDFTNTFRCLSRVSFPGCATSDLDLKEVTAYILTQTSTVEELKKVNEPQMDPRQLQMLLMLSQSNPGLLPMLGRGFMSFTREIERMQKSEELKDLTEESKSERDRESWNMWLQKYVQRLGKEADGVDDIEVCNKQRVELMNNNNPRFILRNYIAQNAIAAAEKGDYSEVNHVLELLKTPFSSEMNIGDVVLQTRAAGDGAAKSTSGDPAQEGAECSIESYDCKPPLWAMDIKVN